MHDLIISSDILNDHQRNSNKERWDTCASFVKLRNSEYTPDDLGTDYVLVRSEAAFARQ
eukprot:TRINITY_DN753_c0_g1_i2.p4 TRINITY_DN753_c0_g1~~TRINITY_DN753_c0_g1_i2.p4  ORF type:complete len:59 (+),score=7.76 TRINITY_DN753_c0_g1_i2:625-801(+)